MPIALTEISEMLADRIAAGDFPSAVYVVTEGGQLAYADALGNAVTEPQKIPASLNTIYDLASLTKPLITGLLCARRLESAELTLDSSVSRYLPEFDLPDKQAIMIRHLVSHSSGLPAWRPLYILAGAPDRVLSTIASLELEYQPGTRVVYSDLGFITLGLLLERLTGERLVQLAASEIIQPLALRQTFFNPASAMQTGIAACELGNTYERETCREGYPNDFKSWRENLIWGEVHDGNAHFLGGAAGHAGLFATAGETAMLANQFLSAQTKLLKPETCAMFRANLTEGLNEARSSGWMLAATKDSSAGADLPRESFGHTGFTGTSCWIDAQKERVYILLTNRTHSRALPFANINSVRRRFHSLASAALNRSSS